METEEGLLGEDFFEPNDEYSLGEGKILEFSYDKNHPAILVKEGDKVIFDFASLVPPNWKMILNPYSRNWRTNLEKREILIGKAKSPKDILAFLHELGHAKFDDNSEEFIASYNAYDEMIKAHNAGNKDSMLLWLKKKAKPESIMERRAWVYAITIMRDLRDSVHIDLRAIFSNFQELKNYVNESLFSYRRGYEFMIEKDPAFEQELRRLFDRFQYREKTETRD